MTKVRKQHVFSSPDRGAFFTPIYPQKVKCCSRLSFSPAEHKAESASTLRQLLNAVTESNHHILNKCLEKITVYGWCDTDRLTETYSNVLDLHVTL